MVKIPQPRNALASSQAAIGGGSRNLAPQEQRRTAPLQTAQTTPDSYGAGVARSLQGVAAGLRDVSTVAYGIQERQEQEHSEIEVKEREIAIRRQLRELENEYLATGQKATVDGWAEYSKRVDEIRSKSSEGLQTEQGRRLSTLAASNLSERALDRGQSHLLGQQRDYRTTLAKTRIDEARQDAIARPGDAGVVAQSRQTARVEARQIAAAQGWDAETTASYERVQVSEITASSIEAMAETDPLQAEGMLNRSDVAGAIMADDLQVLRKSVSEKRERWQVEQGLGFETPDEFRAATKRDGGVVTRAQGSAAAGNAGYVYGALTERGLPPHIAAGIVGNVIQESGPGVNPAAIGDNGAALGIVQWNGPRKRSLEAFAKERGIPATDIDTQIDFLFHEAESSESGAWAKVMEATTTEEAALLFSKHFERPGNPLNSQRVKYAKGIEDKLGTAGVADPRFAGMSKDAREKVLTALDRKVAVALSQREQEFDDYIVALETGIATPDKVPSRKDLTSEFGAEAGGRIADRFEDAVVVNEDLTTISSSNAKDIAARRTEIAENVASLGDDEADTRRLENFDKALNTHAEQVRKDPAGAALAEDETAANIVASLQNRDPAEQGAGLKALIQRSVAAQGEKGVQAFGAEVRALPKAVAETMARTLEGTQPEQLGAVLTALRADMGDMYFDAALEQMVTDAKLDDQIIPIALFSNDQSAMRFLERARDIDIDEVKKRVEKDSQTSVKEAINESVRPYLLAIGADDPNSTRINQGLAVAGLLEKAALAKVATGMEPEDAVAAVMAATIEQGYSIIAEEGGTRVIADRNTADEDTLEAAIDVMMAPERLTDFKPAFVGGDPVTDAVMARFYARDAYFVTSGDGIGAVLSINVRGEDVPVYDREGKPYGFLFKDAQDVIGSAERTSEIVGARRSRQTPDIDPLDPSLEEMVGTAIGNPLENISKETETLGQGARDAFDWLTQPAKPGAGRGGRNRRRN